jgi:hypothetical protein
MAVLLSNGNWRVPRRAEDNRGLLGDGLLEVPANHPEALRWAEWYKSHGLPPPEEDLPLSMASKSFCPTGEGGGVDPSCSPSQGGEAHGTQSGQVDPSALGAAPPATVSELEERAERAFPGAAVEMHGLTDPANAHAGLVGLAKVAAEWPQAAAELKYLGTASGPKAPARMDGFPPRHGLWGKVNEFTPGDQALAFNPHAFSGKDFQERLDRLVQKGFFGPGTNSPAALLTHEFGHVVEGWLNKHTDADVRAGFQKFYREGYSMARDGQVSGYGKTNPSEAWAESFAAIYHTPRSKWSDYTKAQAAFLDTLRNKTVEGKS